MDLLTLRKVQDKCGVSLKTAWFMQCGVSLKIAWFMRHRVLEAISASMPLFRSSAGDGMQVDETCMCGSEFEFEEKMTEKDNMENAAIAA